MLKGKYKFNEIEPNIQKFWKEKRVFKYDPTSSKKTFSVDTPPPTISGSLHIGHVASYTQGEAISRYKRKVGYNVFYPLGFDNNGLPTERLVEKTKNVLATDVSREEFIKLCENSIEDGVKSYRSLFEKLAFSVDWDLTYQTIDERSRRISQRSFLDLAKKGDAYRAQMPVQWCTECKTSIAQAEIDNKEVVTHFHTIQFKADDETVVDIATTRPEYLGACVAIMVNPNDSSKGHLVGKEITVPIYEKKVKVISDEKVDPEKGTGVVMCCTYGDETDVEWVKKYNLPYINAVTREGKMTNEMGDLKGLSINEARKKIVETLKEKNLIKESKEMTHMVASHERCDNLVELLPSKQWFIKILDIKDEVLELANQVNWHPSSMKKRLEIWVENLNRDWLISRQRFFGVPFPVWYCSNCGEIKYPDDEQLPVNPLNESPKSSCSKCGGDKFQPESDVMDTWATSSVTQLINAKWGEKDEIKDIIPMSTRSQAREIIRTWAFYTIVKSYYHTGKPPWENIMINGWVMFDKKNKISKSKHKTKSPEKLIEEYSADAVRYWATATKLGSDTIFAETDLQVGKRFLTKLWNASKFSIMQLDKYNGNDRPKEILPIDNWLINKWNKVKNKAIDNLEDYEIGVARNTLDKFFWDDYCDNYLEIVKERMYQPDKHGYDQRLSGQFTMYKVLYEMISLYNIFVPYITEHIYQEYFSNFKDIDSISIDQLEKAEYDENKIEFGERVKDIIHSARKIKTEKGLSMKDKLTAINITSPDKKSDIEKTIKDLKACTGAEKIEIKNGEEYGFDVKE